MRGAVSICSTLPSSGSCVCRRIICLASIGLSVRVLIANPS